MMVVPPHDQGKGADLGRPENIGITRGLCPPFHHSLVNRAQFVHMVALVGSGAGVHEGEHAGNQQSGFMMRHGIRPGKNRTGLPVLSLAIAEEKGVSGRIGMPQMASLTDKAALQHRPVLHMGTGAKDKISGDNSLPDMYRIEGVAVNASVLQHPRPFDHGEIPDPYIPDHSCIDNPYLLSHRSSIRGMGFHIGLDHLLDPLHQQRAMAVERLDIGQMGRQLVIDGHFPPTGFIQDGNFHSVPKAGAPLYQHRLDVQDLDILSDLIIGNIILHIFNQCVIAYPAIMQRRIPDTRMLHEVAGQRIFLLEKTQPDLPGKTDMLYKLRMKLRMDLYSRPISRRTALLV